MMKRLAALLLLCAFLTNSGLKLAEVLRFAWNHDFIVSELCEQRMSEVNTCNGMCHLKKQMAKVEDTQPAPAEESERTFFQEILIQAKHPLMLPSWTEQDRKKQSVDPRKEAFNSHLSEVSPPPPQA